MHDPIALICSVDLELRPLLERLDDPRPFACGGRAAWTGRIGETPCVVLVGGMGKTNAAQATTALLERSRVSGLIGFGVGGAYHGTGLAIGDLAIASMEIYGDEGVDAPTGWLSTEEMGIPLVDTGTFRCFNEFSVDNELTTRLARGLPERRTFVSGPFVTVSCCSGTRARGEALAARFGAVCETMEGAAYAHVAALYAAPFAEVRGISNLVSDRDLASWRLHDAAEVAAEAIASSIELLSGEPPSGTRPQPSRPLIQRRTSGQGR